MNQKVDLGKTLALALLLALLGMSVTTAPAFSQIINDTSNARPEEPPADMLNLPARPQAATQPAVVAGPAIPPLPPSLPCKAQWITGLWLLQNLYESPAGKESETYALNPMQYVGFGKDSRLYRYNGGRTAMDPKEVLKLVMGHSGALLQYLLQDAGMLYLYQDSVATDSLVCFIVAETHPPYAAGNLILLPPKGAVQGRLIKVYKKVWPPKKPAPQDTAPRQPGRPTIRHFGPR